MTRDMQIGLLLAVGFLALVGGVLYYRIEHPGELEQFWNGSGESAQTKPAAGQDADLPDAAKSTEPQRAMPAVPTPSLPNLEVGAWGSAPNPNTVQPTAGQVSNASQGSNLAAGNPPALNFDLNTPTPATKPSESAAPVLPNMPKLEATPTLAATDKALENAAKPSGHTKAPAVGLNPDLKSEADKSPSNAKNSTVTLPLPPASGPPSLALTNASSNLAQPNSVEKPADEKSIWSGDVKPKGPEAPPASGAPLLVGAPPLMTPTPPSLNDTPKPVPSVPTANSTPTITFPQIEPPKNVPNANSSPLWLDVQPPVKTAPLPSPPEVVPPGNAGNNLEIKPAPDSTNVRTSPNQDQGQYREYPSPRAGLGRPVPESVLAMNERRWSDSSVVSTPIIPSSTEVRANSTVNNGSPLTYDRHVTSDSNISSTRAVNGETFSSLSQRAYGSEMYAEALAAYNHEAGFVEADQPAGNQIVLLPTKFDLENRFGHLLRKQPVRNTVTSNNTGSSTTAPVGSASRDPRTGTAAAEGPAYRVRKGEQLFDVAKLTLGDGYRWGEIYTLNKDLLRDSTELRPDMMLRLPVDAKVDTSKPR